MVVINFHYKNLSILYTYPMKHLWIYLLITILVCLGIFFVIHRPTTSPTTSVISSDDINFPIPTPYPQYTWQKTFGAFDTTLPHGTIYTVSNTDPKALAWQRTAASTPLDQPMAFYSGDATFLNYSDKTLTELGYKDYGSIPLDKDFNIISTGTRVYSLGSVDADGPHGTVREYEKYDMQGNMRVVIISSDDTEDKMFVSEVFNVKSLMVGK